MKYTRLTPCAECPFRKKSLPGWLGPDTGRAAALINEIAGRVEIEPGIFVGCEPMDYACHTHTAALIEQHGKDEEGLLPAEQAHKVTHCAGALLFLKSIIKRPHDPEKCKAIEKVRSKVPMLSSIKEYVEHHGK